MKEIEIDKELTKIDTDIIKLKNKHKNIINKAINKQSKEERKNRTRRLIQIGALTEKYFDCYNISVDDAEELLKIFSSYVISKKPDKFKGDIKNEQSRK